MEENVKRDVDGKSYLYRIYTVHEMSPCEYVKFRNEIGLYANIEQHPNINTPVNQRETMETKTVIFNHYQPLWEHISEQSDSRLGESETIGFFLQMIAALGYLHSKRMIKRDLSIRCFLLDDSKKCLKMGNFSNFDVADCCGDVQNFIANAELSPPETFQLNRTVDGVKMDVWGLGVCLYKMACGLDKDPKYHPLTGLDWKILRHDLPGWMRTERLQNLICKMLDPTPNNRPDMAQIEETVKRHRGNTEEGKIVPRREARREQRKKTHKSKRTLFCIPFAADLMNDSE